MGRLAGAWFCRLRRRRRAITTTTIAITATPTPTPIPTAAPFESPPAAPAASASSSFLLLSLPAEVEVAAAVAEGEDVDVASYLSRVSFTLQKGPIGVQRTVVEASLVTEEEEAVDVAVVDTPEDEDCVVADEETADVVSATDVDEAAEVDSTVVELGTAVLDDGTTTPAPRLARD